MRGTVAGCLGLAIADAIGAGWSELARKAALALSGADAAGADGSLDIKLLADIHGILEDAPGDAIGSTELCEKLVALDLSPWATLSRGKPLTANRLTRMLGPFEVYPKKTAMRNAYSVSFQSTDSTSNLLGFRGAGQVGCTRRSIGQPGEQIPAQQHNIQEQHNAPATRRIVKRSTLHRRFPPLA
jgi:Protein of unknown function (DUF3631)